MWVYIGGRSRSVEPRGAHEGGGLAQGGSVGERSNFKKFPMHTQDHVMHSNEGESIVYVPYADRLRKRWYDVEEVVVRLHDPTDQAPTLRHLRV